MNHLGEVLRIQLTNWRWSWPSMVLTGMLTPIMTLLALGTFSDVRGSDVYIFSGALTIALLFEMQNKIAANFSHMKDTGAFEFFASLPLRREAMIGGTLAAFLLLALPALVVTALVGGTVFELDFAPSYPALVPVVLATAAFAGIGAAIGTACTSVNQASGLSLAATVVLTAIGPVLVPPDRLPDWLVAAGPYNPAALASDALRTLFTGVSAYGLWWDTLGLLVFCGLVQLVLTRAMPWRNRTA